MFTFKKLFKKACLFGISSLFSLNLGSTTVGAVPPTNGSTVGGKYNDFASIGGGDQNQKLKLIPVVITNKGLYYNKDNPQDQLLINTNSSAQGAQGGIAVKLPDGTILNTSNSSGSGVAMYLRAIKQGTSPQANIVWTKVWENGITIYPNGTQLITGKDAGKYDIYYYIDGNNYVDSNGDTYLDSYDDIL